jgi:nitroreductase/NAD-dependent dihydropyrimidine dehydrogenase PreA subunit
MALFEVNQQTCKQDGICAAVCPAGLIDFQKGGYPKPILDAEKFCIRCGHCVAVCPEGSFFHSEMPYEKFPPVQKEFLLNGKHCEHFLRNRRSIRVYKDKPVLRDDIAKLIETARYAPSGHNSQCVEWLVLDNKDELIKLSGIVADWMRFMLSNMPKIALSMHMDKALKRWEDGKDVFLRNAPSLIIAHAEKENRLAPAACTIALSYLELAATSMNLGCCWAGYFFGAATTFPAMMEALSIPKGHVCFGSMMLGYPKFSYKRLPMRKSPVITWR